MEGRRTIVNAGGATRNAAGTIVATGLLTVLFNLACSFPHIAPPKQEIEPFKGFTIPERKPAGSVPLTVAVANPSFASQVTDELRVPLSMYAKFLGSSLDEIITAKGMTAKGPYVTIDEMTYPDKKASDLLLTAQVFVLPRDTKTLETGKYMVDFPGGARLVGIRDVEMTVELWVSYELREPLSGEKLWVKKLDLGALTQSYQVGWQPAEVVFTTRSTAIGSLLGQTSAKVLQNAWEHLNTEEMTALKAKGQEIRDLKRF